MFSGLEWVLLNDIEAGSELFISGEGGFAVATHVPTEDDFKKVDRMMHEALKILSGKELSQELWEDLLGSVKTDRIKTLLPSNSRDLKQASKMGSAQFNFPSSIRSLEWLKEYGWCIDNTVTGGISMIPQAGRGMFATRVIKKGSTVVPVPLIIVERRLTEMHSPVYDYKTKKVSYTDEIIGTQLLINYCYGHPQSSLLLIPNLADGNLINHDGNDPNTAIRWVDKHHLSSEEWLSKSAKEMIENKIGAMMEFYALREINPGEEITVDYGPDWEAAWTKHVEKWVPDDREKDYISAADYIEQDFFKIKTMEEQKEHPYPKNLGTACYSSPTNDYKVLDDVVEVDWSFSTDSSGTQCFYLCDIIAMETSNGTKSFKASFQNAFVGEYMLWANCWLPMNVQYIVTGIPSSAITIIDLPYTSDEHLPRAFRHEIGVPEGFFPPKWLDISSDKRE
jgi:hypothetical protein